MIFIHLISTNQEVGLDITDPPSGLRGSWRIFVSFHFSFISSFVLSFVCATTRRASFWVCRFRAAWRISIFISSTTTLVLISPATYELCASRDIGAIWARYGRIKYSFIWRWSGYHRPTHSGGFADIACPPEYSISSLISTKTLDHRVVCSGRRFFGGFARGGILLFIFISATTTLSFHSISSACEDRVHPRVLSYQCGSAGRECRRGFGFLPVEEVEAGARKEYLLLVGCGRDPSEYFLASCYLAGSLCLGFKKIEMGCGSPMSRSAPFLRQRLDRFIVFV
ncbi:hypothetical protein C8R46DRAFT_1103852 [Mycena filopes]|nr:hypothetical protein C8R46DRAFT_1103852 [Mycena filopes]